MTLRLDPEQISAFRIGRSGLGTDSVGGVAEAAACPAPDAARDSALLALSARYPDLTRGAYDAAVDSGELTVAYALRGGIHSTARADAALFGRALVANRDEELGHQLGRRFRGLAAEEGIAPTDALAEVTEAIEAVLAGQRLDKNELHAALRDRVDPRLMPWCEGCGSHHVAPMLWRYGTVAAGARLDSERRYLLDPPPEAASPEDAVRAFLRFYGPSTAAAFAQWTGVAEGHAARLWAEVEGELVHVEWNGGEGFALEADLDELQNPPEASGVRMIPAGDPLLQKPGRELLALDEGLRRRLFRALSGPGAVLRDGGIVGLWRIKGKGRRTTVTVEKAGRLARKALEPELERLAALRGAERVDLELS